MSIGILPRQEILALTKSGHIAGLLKSKGHPAPQLQPASLDLSLGQTAYRIRASFLPGEGRTVEDALSSVTVHQFKLKKGAVLETGCVYLIPIGQSLNLPDDIAGLANPKSSTGRLDVFTRVICDGADRFDAIPAGYSGPLYVEVAPRTFPILVKTGQRLVQMRLRRGEHQQLSTQTVSIDLHGDAPGAVIGYRAKRHAGLVDIGGVGAHSAAHYWEPLTAPTGELVLDPEEFYILASKESVSIPEDQAAEMAPIAPEIGEFRAHYAGFFDPGFGVAEAGGAGSRAVLEVRGRDVPFLLRHGQSIAKLIYEPLVAKPDALYGSEGSNYQAQGLRLSKHFKD
ncbi:2'-deoxycytidine 5'-triphosphate deaminase domain-containing protein [Litorimonas sp. RW-G-Af-16]|uniref:2'-deoxycytidine 5'-triphosphate deaminase domain-containing protein n=1 Tax=Litorimonas sp. RW-G-Af-16 TaxID=3241168 RepID=UPI00390C6A19